MLKKEYDVVVLGGGPAGIYCSYIASQKGLNTLLIETTDVLGGQPLNLYSEKDIYDFPLFPIIKVKDFVSRLIEQLNSSKTDILFNSDIKELFPIDNQLKCVLKNNEEIIAKNLIIAIGNGLFQPNLLDVPGAKQHKDIQYRISEFSEYNNKQVLILGGGDAAVDFANEIGSKTNAKVYIIHHRDQFRAAGESVKLLTKNNVNVLLGIKIEKVEGNNLIYHTLTDSKTQSLHFDKVIVQYGQKANTNTPEWFNKLNHNPGNRLLVDKNQLTSMNHVYAIGNITFYPNRANMIINAMGEASAAVNDILTKLRSYEKAKTA